MTDYRCPSCDGGFPATHDGCPWCGEAMDGEKPSVDRFGPIEPIDTPRQRIDDIHPLETREIEPGELSLGGDVQ